MAINNMALDASEQKRTFTQAYGLVATGVTLVPFMVATQGSIKAMSISTVGISGAPTYAFTIGRFIVGTGYTVITGGMTTLTATAYGTSGVQPFVIASGSTLLDVLANDLIQVTTGGANTAAAQVTLALVVQATQDVKTQLGS